MKFEEALQAMREGKKVTRKGWPEGWWYELNTEKSVTNSHEALHLENNILADDWEVVPEAKWKPKKYKWFVTSDGDIDLYPNVNLVEATDFGVSRPDQKTSERARDKMRVFNRILAYVDEHAPGWEPDWDDEKQEKWYVVYDYALGRFDVLFNTTCRRDGAVYMPNEIAVKLCEELNSGRVEL